MQHNLLLGLLRTVVALLAILVSAGEAFAQTYTILHQFKTLAAEYPSSLTIDASGNLYGTTAYGGVRNNGIAYKLKHNSNSTFTYSVIFQFKGTNGDNPGGLTFDSAGNLYGVAASGGAKCKTNVDGCGVVFKLKQNANGTWTETVLHSFTEVEGNPYGGVIFDAAGNLYGATNYYNQDCTAYSCGYAFKLTPELDSTWTMNLLYNFTGGAGGDGPTGLSFDGAGNLYGVTALGGSQCGAEGCGVVFQLVPNIDGTWTENVLHTFTGGADGSEPQAGLTFDASGNLYGVAELGGATHGVIFELTPGSGGWAETVLHTFGGTGALPLGPLLFDKQGNIYGVTNQGTNNYGLAYQLTR